MRTIFHVPVLTKSSLSRLEKPHQNPAFSDVPWNRYCGQQHQSRPGSIFKYKKRFYSHAQIRYQKERRRLEKQTLFNPFKRGINSRIFIGALLIVRTPIVSFVQQIPCQPLSAYLYFRLFLRLFSFGQTWLWKKRILIVQAA